jgi:PAS domain S-box-containing protein
MTSGLARAGTNESSCDRGDIGQKLRAAGPWWKQIAETAVEGICVLCPDGVIRFANACLGEMLRCPQQTLEGRSLFDFVFPEDRPDAANRLRCRLEGDRTITEHRMRTVRGEELWVRTAGSQVRSDAGEAIGVLAMMSDVTEQRRREQMLRENEERLRLLIASAREYAVVQTTSEGIVTGWDAGAEQLLGWRADEIIGQPFDLLFTDADRAAGAPDEERRLANASGTSPTDRWMMRRDGTLFWATGALMPVKAIDGLHHGFVQILRDLTDRKRQEDETVRAIQVEHDRLQTTIASTQEELRRLSVALMSAQETERRKIARELHDAAVQDLTVVEMRLTALAREVEPVLVQECTSLREGVASISDRLRSLSHELHSAVLDELGLTVALRSLCDQVQRSSGQPATFAARNVPRAVRPDVVTHVYRIAQEACFNAVRHAGPATIHIHCYSIADALVLTVRDNGSGFDPTGCGRNTGIGLVTMRERARLIDAQLSVTTHPGRGTRVRLIIPVEKL